MNKSDYEKAAEIVKPYQTRINFILEELIKDRRRTIEHSREILENCNPQSIFERGYSMVTDRDGNIIRDAHNLNSGDQIKIRPAKGEIEATVN